VNSALREALEAERRRVAALGAQVRAARQLAPAAPEPRRDDGDGGAEQEWARRCDAELVKASAAFCLRSL